MSQYAYILPYVIGGIFLAVRCTDTFGKEVEGDRIPPLIRRIYAKDLAEPRAYSWALIAYIIIVLCLFLSISFIVSKDAVTGKLFGIEGLTKDSIPIYVALGLAGLRKLSEFANIQLSIKTGLQKLIFIPAQVIDFDQQLKSYKFKFSNVKFADVSKNLPFLTSEEEWRQFIAELENPSNLNLAAWIEICVLSSYIQNSVRRLGDPANFFKNYRHEYVGIKGEFSDLRDDLFSRLLPHMVSGAAPNALREEMAKFLEEKSDNVFAIRDNLYLFLASLETSTAASMKGRGWTLGRYTNELLPPKGVFLQTKKRFGLLVRYVLYAGILSMLVTFLVPLLSIGSVGAGSVDSFDCLINRHCILSTEAGWPNKDPNNYRQLVVERTGLLFLFQLMSAWLFVQFLKFRNSTTTHTHLRIGPIDLLILFFFCCVGLLMANLFGQWMTNNFKIFHQSFYDFWRNWHFLRPIPYIIAYVLVSKMIIEAPQSKHIIFAFFVILLAILVNYLFFVAPPIMYGTFVAWSIVDAIYFGVLFATVSWRIPAATETEDTRAFI